MPRPGPHPPLPNPPGRTGPADYLDSLPWWQYPTGPERLAALERKHALAGYDPAHRIAPPPATAYAHRAAYGSLRRPPSPKRPRGRPRQLPP